ncbi:DMT family transporter [Jannaschia ovalis]|uniref:DMT family transporter n=1 Tax=Jannaschia ovalis TaxID=3038773 RepID=A0ABY8LFQ9_9RHOB|nr:DMT family transporter [Jannaschia sp. GRR-S6-38]WGH78950.1 DMT family transporter [Jannaschia sp. GRR-S6-38]
MEPAATTRLASLIVLGTGVLWGLYWLPVRELGGLGLGGAWGTAAITGAAALLLAPMAWVRRSSLAAADPVALASVALGGVAFMLYSVGFLYGRVALIVLLFFLTPVWSTILGRVLMGWPTPRLRLAAIGLGLVGLVVMLGAGDGPPVPQGLGEWMGLASGLLWSVATTGMRARPPLGAAEGAFVFAGGAALGALALAPLLSPLPAALALPALAWAAAAGALWWGLSIAALTWASARLEPARTGLLLMTEVLVSAVSAAVLAGEHLGPREMAGGALVLLAGVLEVWPVRRARRVRS